MPAAKAANFADTMDQYGQAVCATYQRDAANKLVEAARQSIQASGHPLLITTEAITAADAKHTRCKVCGTLATSNPLSLSAVICNTCNDKAASKREHKQFEFAFEALAWHFAGIPQDRLVATSRQFPGHMRPDVQVALEKLFSASAIRFFGLHERHRYETLTIAALTRDDDYASGIAPAQYHDVDVGDSDPVKCLHNGLWLCQAEGLQYAVLLSTHREHGYETGTRIEIAVA